MLVFKGRRRGGGGKFKSIRKAPFLRGSFHYCRGRSWHEISSRRRILTIQLTSAFRRGPRGWDIDGEGSVRIFILETGFSAILLIELGEDGRGRGWRGRTIARQALRQWRNGWNAVFGNWVLTGTCALLIAGRFTRGIYVGAVPFRFPHGKPNGGGGS
jgi:hypothetical protein